MTRPVVIDTDPGCDDALALLLALERSELDLVGLTTSHGNTAVDATTTNARSILELTDRTDVPIAKGADRPLAVDLQTAEHIHGSDGIRGPLPEPTEATRPVDTHAATFIVEQARAHEGELTLAALAPLTNVALALALEPDLPELLDELVLMGGAAFSPGNVTQLAEANFHSDPHAAHRVVRDLDPTIVGLDVTKHATLPSEWVDSIPRDDPLGRSINEWLTYYSAEHLERYDIDSAPIHDALVIAALVDDVLETDPFYMEVGTDSDLAQGALVCDPNDVTGNEPNGTVAVDADYERYRDLFVETIDRFVAETIH
ncbi:nucleoside hydrolase [Halopiger djelfimassiliensis]|uniref:nucleoside hydrolase n=1 Tax=Halopiger djelfimassiliensis TaxID=1293047 RepID=UPI000677B3F3|nr:nucleoside hydrolase [Halopiger djelfimassiliensis]